jgi:eukaryotic-like serine/threonine-protein kinase
VNPGDILHDRYLIIQLLGQGGFGRTYLAKDTQLNDRLCAIKEIPPQSNDPNVLQQARSRFDREVRALSQLGQHPQIPQIFDQFEEDKNFYLVQEYIEGNSLSDELTPGEKWEETQAIALLQDILNILSFVHKQGVIHRDIKPSNLIRRTDGKIVMIDFGAVREIGTLMVNELGEIATTTIGSPGYMPPDQQYGNPGFYSDIYAVGIIIIQALTGFNPNRCLRDPDTCEIIWVYSTPDRPMISISDRLKAIIDQMIRYDFKQRYQSVLEILQDLEPISVMIVTSPIQQNRSRSFSIWHGILLGICGGAIGLSSAIILYKFFTPKTCNTIEGDHFSCGEEILITGLNPVPKKDGVEAFLQSKYQNSLEFFQNSWREDKKDPETLIYMNNALLEAIDADYYTIAITVPLRRNEAGAIISEDLALEILRGVAQAQTEVNLSLLEQKGDNQDFPGRSFLEKINLKGKGLRVVIADDGNQVSQAQKVATSLTNTSDVLAVLGHYASDMTIEVVDTYDRHQIVLMSFGSTTNKLTKNPRNFFFRTVGSTQSYAPLLAQYLIKKNITKAVLFYNPSSPFTYSFQEDFKHKFLEYDGTAIKRAILGEFDLTKKEVVEQELSKLKNQPDVAIVLSPDGEVTDSRANAIELFKANNDRHWIASSEGLNNQTTLEIASQLNSFDKIVISTHWHSLSSQNPKFPKEASQLWGGQVNTTTALTYDAARSLIEAIEQQPKPSRIGMQKTMRNQNFKAEGATGTIQFDPKTGDRQNPPQQLIHIVRCQSEQYGVTFVPIEFETAEAAGVKCDGDR